MPTGNGNITMFSIIVMFRSQLSSKYNALAQQLPMAVRRTAEVRGA